MRRAAALFAAFVAGASAKNSTYFGMYKATWAASDPIHTTFPFLTKYLGNLPTDNNCPDLTCACGTQGRTELNGTHGFGSEDHFGVHTVEAAGVNGSRLRASGAYSLAEVEAIWDATLGDMDAYDTFMDNHLALWTATLVPFAAALDADGVPYLGLRWLSEGVEYYSMIVHVPKSQVVLEIISTVAPEGFASVYVAEARHRFLAGPPRDAPPGRLDPLHVSRYAADLDEVERFYEAVLGEKPNAVDAPLDGADATSKRLVYGGPGSFTPEVSLQFVFRAEKTRGAAARRSAAWFQRYTVNVGKQYMHNYTDCWPVWGDNHVAVQMDRVDAGKPTLDDVVRNLDAIGWHLHHPFKGACKAPGDCGPSDIYLMDPTGWTTQLVSPAGFGKGTLPGADVDSGGLSGYCFTFCE